MPLFLLPLFPVEGGQVVIVSSVLHLERPKPQIVFMIADPPVDSAGMFLRPLLADRFKAIACSWTTCPRYMKSMPDDEHISFGGFNC